MVVFDLFNLHHVHHVLPAHIYRLEKALNEPSASDTYEVQLNLPKMYPSFVGAQRKERCNRCEIEFCQAIAYN